MDALVMCGGEGTRLATETEKPLYPIGGQPMVDRVRRALTESSIETVYAVVSPNAPETREHLERAALPTIATAGEGYVADLAAALADSRVEPPVLTVAADLPLLSAEIVDEVREAYRERTGLADDARPSGPPGSSSDLPSMTVCVPRELKRDLGVTVDESPVGGADLVPTGLNVIGAATDDRTDDATETADDGTAGATRTADAETTADAAESDAGAATERVHVRREPGAAINVNRLEDARVAERHATR